MPDQMKNLDSDINNKQPRPFFKTVVIAGLYQTNFKNAQNT